MSWVTVMVNYFWDSFSCIRPTTCRPTTLSHVTGSRNKTHVLICFTSAYLLYFTMPLSTS